MGYSYGSVFYRQGLSDIPGCIDAYAVRDPELDVIGQRGHSSYLWQGELVNNFIAFTLDVYIEYHVAPVLDMVIDGLVVHTFHYHEVTNGVIVIDHIVNPIQETLKRIKLYAQLQ